MSLPGWRTQRDIKEARRALFRGPHMEGEARAR